LSPATFFYGWWDVRFLFLIVVSTVIDFVCGLMIARGQVPLKERLLASLYVSAAAFFFMTIPWTDAPVFTSQAPWLNFSELANVLATKADWFPLLATVGVATVFNLLYGFLEGLGENARRKTFLWTSITANLSILGFFKYFNFFADSLETAVAGLGMSSDTLRLDIILPVGISFYTFQTMSYAIDIYRRQLEPTDKFLDFALFVSYFPQLVAGPIERASELLPRILKPRKINLDQITQGSFLILWGLFKKVAIADGVAGAVDSIFLSTGDVTWADIVVGTVLFAVQIYCDFSGYTDIARGVSKLMGIDLMLNFNQPYFSTNPSEFWRRWHISLSSWLRDYLYIPLGGNRGGKLLNYRNLMITMVLGGLWHGAAWNYVLWGFYQGGILCAHIMLFGKAKKAAQAEGASSTLATLKQAALTVSFFGVTCYGWLLFRAVSLDQVVAFTSTLIFDFGELALTIKTPTLAAVAGLPLLVLYEFFQYRAADPECYTRLVRPARGFLYACILFLTCMGMSNDPAQFIYFQF
jgi:D-alanyl-lipoteichoic acid acyltransferase DltB (MBOAT superfamily)